jgi:hypothetical protein
VDADDEPTGTVVQGVERAVLLVAWAGRAGLVIATPNV